MRVLLVFFPFIFMGFILAVENSPKQNRIFLRDILLSAAVMWGTILLAITEGSSLIKQLNRTVLTACWGGVDVLLAALLVFMWWKRRKESFKFDISAWLAPLKRIGSESRLEWGMVGLLAVMILVLGWVASVYPPNNNDSMTYHLARVMHWQQNQSLAPYATSIDRQIQMPPFTEEIFLNLTELTGSSQADNFVQFGAYLICLLGVSSITARLGGKKTAQQAAALICAAIPMAVLQATSTQNDLTAAAWLICFIDLGFILVERPTRRLAVLTGLPLGLALLTKTTSYVFALPFCIWFAVRLFQNRKIRAIGLGALIVGILLLTNLGHFSRMYAVYGNPLGPTDFYRNQAVSAAGFSSNLIRNTALNFMPDYQDGVLRNDLNTQISRGFAALHRLTGLQTLDLRFSIPAGDVFSTANQASEDLIGNPIHLGLILIVCTAIVPLAKKKKIEHNGVVFFVCTLCSFLLYCLVFKWQLWGNRLLLPVFVLFSPLIALVCFNHRFSHSLILPILIGLAACNTIVYNHNRPILPDKYNLPYGDIYWRYYGSDMKNAAKKISRHNCQNVGVVMAGDSMEYLLWFALDQDGFQGRIEHIRVPNETAKFEDPGFSPCVVYVETGQLDGYADWNSEVSENGTIYFK
jgi:hypothetical protein